MSMFMPSGYPGPLQLEGLGRDLVTAPDGTLLPAGEDRFSAAVEPRQAIESLTTTPDWPELAVLVGQGAIAGFRGRLHDLLEGREDRGRPLGTLLNEIAPCTLISAWVHTIPADSPLSKFRKDPSRLKRMMGICAGFREGSDAFDILDHDPEPVQIDEVWNSSDVDGWHAVPPARPTEMRRARRLDVWREDDLLKVDAMFQDSALLRDGTRRAVHDYAISAAFHADDGRLAAIEAMPRVLPHHACPAAAAGVKPMVGAPARALHARVLDELRGVAGCTHLNDATRALGVVPWLGQRLESMLQDRQGA